MGQFTLSFDAFRFFGDGTESGSAGLAAQGTNLGFDLSADFNFQLRVRLQESGGKAGASTDDYRLQYRKNGGTWTDVTTTSSNVKGFDSTHLTDGGATTNRLSGGSGSFVAGKISETGEVVDHQITASNHTEYLYSLTLIAADIALNDEIEFRVLRNGSTFTYNAVPQFTRLNLPPTVTLNTPDQEEFGTKQPSFEFTGEDPEGDDITYNFQIAMPGVTVYSSPLSAAGATSNNLFLVVDAIAEEVERLYDLGSSNDTFILEDDFLIWIEDGKIKKVNAYDFGEKAFTDDFDGLPNIVASDPESDYFFFEAGSSGTGYDLYKAQKSDLVVVLRTTVARSASSYALAVDQNNVFATQGLGGFLKYNHSLSVQGSRTDTGYYSHILVQDEDYVYCLDWGVCKIAKSDLSLTTHDASTERRCLDIDDDYLYWMTLSTSFFIISKLPKGSFVDRVWTQHNLSLGTVGHMAIKDGFIYFYAQNKLFKIDTNDLSALESTDALYIDGDTTSYGARHIEFGDSVIILDKSSDVDEGFENVDTPANTDPFNSGDKIKYTVQPADELEEGEYQWRVRGKDPNA